jgi:mRNA interferase MazF
VTVAYAFGTVLLVPFPFTNQQGAKPRPAVVVSRHDYNEARPDVILMPITSQVRTPLAFGEAMLADWQAAGLLKPSVVKPVLFTLEKALIRKTLGQLSVQDQELLSSALECILGC